MNSTFEAQFDSKGTATLKLNREHLEKFKRMVREFEAKGKPRTRIGLMKHFPIKKMLMGQVTEGDEPIFHYISRFEEIDRIEIAEGNESLVEVTFHKKYHDF